MLENLTQLGYLASDPHSSGQLHPLAGKDLIALPNSAGAAQTVAPSALSLLTNLNPRRFAGAGAGAVPHA